MRSGVGAVARGAGGGARVSQPQPPASQAPDVEGRLAARLASLELLDERPVSEHIMLLEAAHEVLRETLDGSQSTASA